MTWIKTNLQMKKCKKIFLKFACIYIKKYISAQNVDKHIKYSISGFLIYDLN